MKYVDTSQHECVMNDDFSKFPAAVLLCVSHEVHNSDSSRNTHAVRLVFCVFLKHSTILGGFN